MSGHLLLVDSSGFAYRAFHTSSPTYRKDGLPTWATVGFLAMLYYLRQRAESDNPTHAAAVFDSPKKNFRHKLLPTYKGNRNDARRKELLPQFPYMKHAASVMGLEPVEVDGWEADDVLATMAKMATERGWRTTLVSGDKDMTQIIRDGWVEVVDPVQRKRILEADVMAKFGVPPALVPDVQSLWGDAVDNIPGIDGIGGKSAGKLISRFGGLEGLLQAVGQSGQVVATPAIRNALRKSADAARLYKELATLRTDVPLEVNFDTLRLHPVDMDHLKEMLKVLEAGHRFDALFSTDPSETVRLPHVPAPLRWWTQANKKGVRQPYVDAVQDGWFKRRLVAGGPWVAARIWRTIETDFVTGKETGFDIVRCEVNGRAMNPLRQWDALQRFPISVADFDYMAAKSDWAKKHAPESPDASPHLKIDWNKVPLE